MLGIDNVESPAERTLGLNVMVLMGPKQVAIANKVFGYTPEQLARAKYIKEIFEANSAKGINGFMDERYDIFVDEPIYKDALVVLGEKI